MPPFRIGNTTIVCSDKPIEEGELVAMEVILDDHSPLSQTMTGTPPGNPANGEGTYKGERLSTTGFTTPISSTGVKMTGNPGNGIVKLMKKILG